MARCDISVVIPLFNEEEIVGELLARLWPVLEKLEVDFEVIIVNDGSSDGSWEVLKKEAAKRRQLRLIGLSRRFGHQVALSAGLQYAGGSAVVLMDGDLQDAPEDIPRLLAEKEKGYDVVYAVRRRRSEGILLRLFYFFFYRLLRLLSQTAMPLDAGDFCVLDRLVAEQLRRMPETHRFLRGLRAWSGFRQTGLPLERASRRAGATKYSLGMLFNLALDGIMTEPKKIFRLLSLFGACLSCLVILIGIAVLGIALPNLSRFGLIAAAGLVLAGLLPLLIFLILGLYGEYLARVLAEARGRPLYIISEMINIPAETLPPEEN